MTNENMGYGAAAETGAGTQAYNCPNCGAELYFNADKQKMCCEFCESEFSVSKKAEETLFSHSRFENVIYMNTFSQTVSPSLRVGYMVLPAGLVDEFEKKMGFYSCTVPTYMQLVLARLMDNGDFERHINRVRRQKRKALMQK